MTGIVDLAKMLKERENTKVYAPLFGTVIDIIPLKIRIGDKIILEDKAIKSIINIEEKNDVDEYININKEAVLLPYADGQQFVLIGVVI